NFLFKRLKIVCRNLFCHLCHRLQCHDYTFPWGRVSETSPQYTPHCCGQSAHFGRERGLKRRPLTDSSWSEARWTGWWRREEGQWWELFLSRNERGSYGFFLISRPSRSDYNSLL